MIYVTLAVLWRIGATVDAKKQTNKKSNQSESYWRIPKDGACIKVVAVELERDRLWKCFEGRVDLNSSWIGGENWEKERTHACRYGFWLEQFVDGDAIELREKAERGKNFVLLDYFLLALRSLNRPWLYSLPNTFIFLPYVPFSPYPKELPLFTSSPPIHPSVLCSGVTNHIIPINSLLPNTTMTSLLLSASTFSPHFFLTFL